MSPALLLLLALSASESTLPAPAAPVAEVLRARWTEAMKLHQVLGLAVAGVKDGKVVLLEALGKRRPSDPALVTPDTRFYIASITKVYVATVARMLAEEGKLDLGRPVRAVLPSFELADRDAAAAITVEDLLCHRPGLHSAPIPFRDAYTGQIDDAVYFELLSRVIPGRDPSYSNVHFTLAGRALQAVGQEKDWRDLLDKRLFRPLGLTRTTGYASVAWADADSAEPCRPAAGGPMQIPHKSDRTMHAAGGLTTSARDAARFLCFHLSGLAADGTVLLPEAALADMRERRTSIPPDQMAPGLVLDGFGLGWQLGKYRDEPIVAHGGGYSGASAQYFLVPGRQIGVVMLCNTGFSPALELVLLDTLKTLLGEPLGAEELERMRTSATRLRLEPKRAAAKDPAQTAGGLTLAVDAYLGRYTHDTWGEVEVWRDAGALVLTLGDIGGPLDSTGPDAFRFWSGVLGEIAGKFDVDADAKVVDGVSLPVDDNRRVWFERVAP